ncbi:MAG: M48 family metallopeptidase [Candidatus Electrothrix aestuarii]|uniref:M48 family metallopeptidase n=1 Tax=Candidatus Electrothrix aestuarii TaxID=3062594 RepID=A0AAU8LVK8_9BACT|nr:M48 family metallopeptidase [Candidatus Electrothrix aestuarii]
MIYCVQALQLRTHHRSIRLRNIILLFLCLISLCTVGCDENTDMQLATEAGLDAVRAVTLTDKAVQRMALRSSAYADSKRRVASPTSKYAQRLQRLVGDHYQEGDLTFNYKVYLAQEVNAFAMADGTIRVYSGLMDMFTDDELRFVIGHEMGHVTQKHIHKKLRLAYASSAVRKAVAANKDTTVGEIARSGLGEFVENLMQAQFSQLEEKEADDYSLAFMKKNGYAPQAAVTALKKLASLRDGKNTLLGGLAEQYLSSHPIPGKRAERLQMQLEGKAVSIAEQKEGLWAKTKGAVVFVVNLLVGLLRWLANLL